MKKLVNFQCDHSKILVNNNWKGKFDFYAMFGFHIGSWTGRDIQ